MELALEEARKGLGRTAPNPAVGAVVVQDGTVVGRGYHKKAGTPHAEVNAIQDAGEKARGGTIYVTLEPCNHSGRTPPCTQAILRAGLRQVIIGAMDPNPRVVGGGAAFLRGQGVDVVTGVLEEQCQDIIRSFVKHSSSGLPWVIMKAGLSLDGKIAFEAGKGGMVTGPESSRAVHLLRDQVDAILVGVGTALIDDPSLTTRIAEKHDARDPLRLVVDTHLRLRPQAKMLRQESAAQTWIFCGEQAPAEREQVLLEAGAVVHRLPIREGGRLDLHSLLAFIGEQALCSLLVEGGSTVHGAFWSQGLVDELRLYYAPYFIGDNGVALLSGYGLDKRPDRISMHGISLKQHGEDFLFRALVAR